MATLPFRAQSWPTASPEWSRRRSTPPEPIDPASAELPNADSQGSVDIVKVLAWLGAFGLGAGFWVGLARGAQLLVGRL